MKRKQEFVQKWLFVALSIACFFPYVETPMALFSGLMFGLILGCPSTQWVSRWTKTVLQMSVVGLGFGVPIEQVLSQGRQGLVLAFVSITVALICGYLLSRFWSVPPKTATLISVGTAICGGSAIAAVAPVIHAHKDDITVSMASVFTLNAIALFLFPWLGRLLEMKPETFGLWAALSIHDTSSVVGAASVFGEKALALATTIKLSRAIWILPLVVFYSMLNRVKGKITIPWFIFLFIGAACLKSLAPHQWGMAFGMLNALAKKGLCLVLFWIGASMNRQSLQRVGWRPFMLSIMLWIILAGGSLWYVLNF